MKNLFRSMMAIAAIAMMAMACGEDPQVDDPKPEPKPEPGKVTRELTLNVDKSSIVADGEDTATFSVTLVEKEEGKEESLTDVTAEAEIFCQTTDSVVATTFNTTTADEYNFVAMYDDLTSKVISVEAKEPQNAWVPETDHANVPTPVKWSENLAKPIDPTAGVEIEVTGVQEKNFQFVCRPGEFVQSYRLDVFPVCRLYNSLLETCLAGDATKKADWDTVEEAILSFVFNSTGSGAFIMSPATQGADYAEYEYDWMNTQYSQAKVVPHSEYVIVAVGCFDTEGTEPGEMTICYVHTPGQELIGNPEIYINVETGYRSFIVDNIPNPDCHYMYYWCSNEDDLMPYINGYGDKQYIDFMRHTLYDPISAFLPEDAESDPRSYYQNFGQSASSEVPIMATAIALDRNETPAKEFNSKVFTLVPIPPLEEGEATMSVIEDRISAHVAWYEVTIGANAHSMLFQIMTEEQAAMYKDADEDTLKQLALQINAEGWGINNQNWSVDAEGTPNGKSYTTQQPWLQAPGAGALAPGETYVFCYIARNAATELSTPKFTEPFTMKNEVRNQPEACQATGEMVLTSGDRQKVNIAFKNDDIENNAVVYFQFIEPNYGTQPSRDADRDTFINYLVGDAFTNIWTCEPEYGFGSFTVIMDPGTEYVYAYVVEDWNGVLSEVKFASVKTENAAGGPNPAAFIHHEIKDGVCTVWFEANEDTEYMKYMTSGPNSEGLALKYLGDTSVASGEEMYAVWKMYCADYGLQTSSLAVSTPQYLESNGEPWVALALSYGRDASGASVTSELTYIIYDGGTEVKTLHDYYPSYSGFSAPAPAPFSYQSPMSGLMPEMHVAQSSVVYEASAMTAPVTRQRVVKDTVQQGTSVRYIWLDMEKLGAHPHAKVK